MKRPVYLAGAVAEIERAAKWVAVLKARGIEVTSTWVDAVPKEGIANPPDERRRLFYARKDLGEIEEAWEKQGCLWMLAPAEPNTSHGAYFELGYATNLGMPRFVSGEYKRSIFTALAQVTVSDDEVAFKRVARYCEGEGVYE